KVIRACGGSVRNKAICVLGLTFKPNTDDMREAPSLAVIQALQDAGATIRAYDPGGMEQARAFCEDVRYCDSAYAAAEGAHATVIVTEWDEFRSLDLTRLKALMAAPVLVDFRNIYDRGEVHLAGMGYAGIGRPEGAGVTLEESGLRQAG